jgi:4'-phosphopantetheinyl transferase
MVRCFTPAEHAWINEASTQRDGFFRAWTLKEAYLKATGLGIRVELKDLEILRRTQDLIGIHYQSKPEANWTFETRKHEHFRLAWCEALTPNPQRNTTWEFKRFAK